MSLIRSSYEQAEAEQAEGRRAWVDGVFLVIMPDAYEPEDLVERAGTDRVAVVGIFSINEQPNECLKGTCWLPSSACDTCIHDGAKPRKMKVRSAEYLKAVQKDMEEIHDLLVRYKKCSCVPLQMQNVMGDGRHAAQDEVHEMATNCRGIRARAEQQGLGRMRF